MKKKMLLGIAALLFIAATAINVNLTQQSQNNNALLANIAVMALAQDGEHANICDPIWTVTYSGSIGTSTGVTVECSSDGSYVCPICF